MTDQSPLLDPEVEAIMREVAQDPDSVLLRVDRPKELRVIDAGGDTIVRGTVGLSKAEKQLLEVHREEAAYLLRLAYYELAKRLGTQRTRGLLLYPSAAGSATTGLAETQKRLKRERIFYSDDADSRAALDAGLCVISNSSSNLVDLAIGSLRLMPSLAARSYVGSEHQIAEHYYSAESTYRALCHEAQRPQDKANFLAKLGGVLARTGRLFEWRESMRNAAELAPAEDRALSWLAASIQTGHLAQAQDALRLVNSMWPTPTHQTLAWIAAVESQRVTGQWEPTRPHLVAMETLSSLACETTELVFKMLRGEAGR